MENQKIPDIIHPSWHPYLQPLFNDKKMILINNNVLPRCKYYPEASDIFKVFRMPLQEVKVVILGQDPYYNGSANGLAFAVNRTTVIPKSLSVIKNEIINSKVERDTYINIDSDRWKELAHWERQGILLLNSALTVGVGESGSHTGQWQWFTREVVKAISLSVRPVWLLWGSKAISYNAYIMYYKKSTEGHDHSIEADQGKGYNYGLEAPHPAAESYPDSKYKFTGCNHFNKCNKILKDQGKKIINW